MGLFHVLETARLQFATAGHSAEVVGECADHLEARGDCGENLQTVCIDLSGSYRAGLDTHTPSATVTLDAFHVIQLLGKAVDEVRREDGKSIPMLNRARNTRLKGTHAWITRQTFKARSEGILNTIASRPTNARVEVANAPFQAAKACGSASGGTE